MKTKKSIAGYICAVLLLVLVGIMLLQFVYSCVQTYNYYDYCQGMVKNGGFYWNINEINYMNTSIIYNIVNTGFILLETIFTMFIALSCVIQKKRTLSAVAISAMALFGAAEFVKNAFLWNIIFAIISGGTASAVFETIFNVFKSPMSILAFIRNIPTHIDAIAWIVLAIMAWIVVVNKSEKSGKIIGKMWFVPAIIVVVCNVLNMICLLLGMFFRILPTNNLRFYDLDLLYTRYNHSIFIFIISLILEVLCLLLISFVQILLARYIASPFIEPKPKKVKAVPVKKSVQPVQPITQPTPAKPVQPIAQPVPAQPIQPVQPTVTKPSGNEALADEIKKYKDLLDAGLITEEEYSAKKKQILGL